MSLICPKCDDSALRLEVDLELPPRGVFTERTRQLWRCGNCGAGILALYEESRAGRLDSEVVNHSGRIVDAAKFEELVEKAYACPNRLNASCPCEVHRFFDGELITK